MKKGILSFVLVCCMMLTLVPTAAFAVESKSAKSAIDIWDGSIANGFASGNGTKDDPYIIETAAQLAFLSTIEMGQSGQYYGKYYRLVNDIYLNDVPGWENWDQQAPSNVWSPIGSFKGHFNGFFDGEGHVISGVYINSSEDYQGLFAGICHGGIKNLGIVDSYIKGNDYVGGLAGQKRSHSSFDKIEIENCYFAGNVFGNSNVGGIVGYNYEIDSAMIENCQNFGSINGVSNVGGIAGYNLGFSTGRIECCYNNGPVTGTSFVGGIVGYNTCSYAASSYIRYCYNAGTVKGNASVGGIAGSNQSTSITLATVWVENCYNIGTVNGNYYTGGIIGYNRSAKGSSSSCGAYLKNSYNVGTVHGKYYNAGGVVGYNSDGTAFINNCYYLRGCAVDGYDVEQGGVGCNSSGSVAEDKNGVTKKLSDEEMQKQESFAGFDFDTVWGMPSKGAYRYPILLNNTPDNEEGSFKFHANTPTNCIEIGTTFDLHIGYYVDEQLDCSLSEFILVVSDSNIIDIVSGGWNDIYGRQYTITAKKVGYTTLTVTNPQTGVAKALEFYVVETASGYSFNGVPKLTYEEGKTTNFYNYNGLVVDEFAYMPHKDESGKIDYYIVTMTVYNSLDLYGAVTAYDMQGNVAGFSIIDKKTVLASNFVGSVKDLIKEIGDLFYLIGNDKYYSGESISKKTDISIKVPAGGYLEISNSAFSDVSVLANVFGLLIDGVSTISDFGDSSDTIIAEKSLIIDQLLADAIKEDFVGKKLSSTIKDAAIDELKHINLNNYGQCMEAFLSRLTEAGFNMMDALAKKICSVTGIASITESVVKKIIPTGPLIDWLYDVMGIGEQTVAWVTFQKSTEFSNGIYIYAPITGKSYNSNGVIVTPENITDSAVVVHSYRVIDSNEIEITDSTFPSEGTYLDGAYETYSITMYRDGHQIQPDAPVTVRIPLTNTFQSLEESTIKVYRHNEDGTVTDMNASIIDGYAVFSTEHFSYYSIVGGTTIAVSSISLNIAAMTLTAVGQVETLVAIISPEGATNKNITWTSDAPSVATVNAAGVVTAIGCGTAIITATTNDGGYTATCEVTVTTGPNPIEPSIAIKTQPQDLNVVEGSTGNSLSVEAETTSEEELLYQWYACDDDDGSNPQALDGETHNIFYLPSYTLPADLDSNAYYYFCEVSTTTIDAVETNVVSVTVTKADGEDTHIHHWATEWSSDSTQHWHSCLTEEDPCGERKDVDEHVYDNDSDDTCNVCGYLRTVVPPILNYTITFDANGGTVTPANVVTNTDGRLPVLPAPARNGYIFNGWYTSANAGTKITTNTVFEADTTVYAQWSIQNIPGSGSSGGSGASGYSITIPKIDNGSFSVSPKSAKKGDTVTITVKPDVGYELDSLTVTDKNSDSVKLTKKSDTQYTFVMPASKVNMEASFVKIIDSSESLPFTDVAASAYYYDAVKWAAAEGITGGTTATTFSPNAPCTRAQIVTFLWRAAGSPEPENLSDFSDVSADAYYAKAVAWALENGITGGTGNGMFSPDTTCTRSQSMTFLYRAAGSPTASEDIAFGDVTAESYYADAVAWAAQNGITSGIGNGLFGPANECSRAQIVTFLYRWLVK